MLMEDESGLQSKMQIQVCPASKYKEVSGRWDKRHVISMAGDNDRRSQAIPCENCRVGAHGKEVKIRLDRDLEIYRN